MSNYEIGYAKPPKTSQFKKGLSGNRKGRPKGSKNTYKLLDELLAQKIPITQNGKTKNISKKAAILLQAVNSATKGDIRSIQTIFPHMLVADMKNEERENIIKQLSTNDDAIIKTFIKNNYGN